MATKKAYATTEVVVSKSQEELRGLLVKFGAQQFSFGEGRDWAGVEFVHDNQIVRVRCPLRAPDDKDVKARQRTQGRSLAENVDRLIEQEAKRVWRVLVWCVKARLVAVEEGLQTFEQAFLSDLVDPATNRTLWEQVRVPVEAGAFQIGGSGLRELGSGQ